MRDGPHFVLMKFIAGPSLHLVFCNWLLHCAIASIARISDRQCQPLSSVRRLASSQRGAVSFVSINASRALRLSILTKHRVPTAPIPNRAPRTAISTPPKSPLTDVQAVASVLASVVVARRWCRSDCHSFKIVPLCMKPWSMGCLD